MHVSVPSIESCRVGRACGGEVRLVDFCEFWENVIERIGFQIIGRAVSESRVGMGREEYTVLWS